MALSNRSLKPYPVANYLIVDTSTSAPSGQVRLTWKNRNRLISGIKKQTDAGDALETGQTHTIRVYGQSGTTLLRTITLLTTEIYDYTAAFELADTGLTILQTALTLKIKSVRDGYESAEISTLILRTASYVIEGIDNVVEGTDRVIV